MNGVKNISINKKSGAWLKFVIGTFVLLFFIAVINFFNSGIKNVFFAFSAPIQKTFWTAGEISSNTLGSFLKAGALSKENNNLKQENQRLLSQVASLQAIKDGNEAQTAVSLSCQNNGLELLMAGAIGLDEQDILSINKGLADGISEGMPVINQEGALFGKVLKVYKNFSKVMLISSKNSVINVKIKQNNPAPSDAFPIETEGAEMQPAQKTEIDGVIKGNGQLGVFLDLVPIDDTLREGDFLVTSALEGTFPKDLLVGKITKVEKNDQNPYQQAKVQPFFNVSTENLFVVTNYKQG